MKFKLLPLLFAMALANGNHTMIKRGYGVPGGPAAPAAYGSYSGVTVELRAEGLWTVCRQNQKFVQLGVCNSHFMECASGGQLAVRKCPFNGEVFMGGRCLAASKFPVCSNGFINSLQEETSRLAKQFSLCSSGGAVYRGETNSRQECSQQSLICHTNGRDVIPVICANGETISRDLSCRRRKHACYGGIEELAPVRQYFLQQLCPATVTPPTFPVGPPAPPPFIPTRPGEPVPAFKAFGVEEQKYYGGQPKECDSWYVLCQPRPTVVRCEPGHVFDARLRRCAPWTKDSGCYITSVCKGNEFRSIALGKCSAQFIYCEGQSGKYQTCANGMVFDGTSCVNRANANCPVCTVGEKRRSQNDCAKYFQCTGDYSGTTNWILKDCPAGSQWSESRNDCQRGYQCAQQQQCKRGSIVLLTCNRFLYCDGHGYQESSCGFDSRFDPASRTCVPDRKCNPNKWNPGSSCRDGDVLSSTDCQSFKFCQNGRYQSSNCMVNGQVQPACGHCSFGSGGYGVDNLNFPAECQENEQRAHSDDCHAFYRCVQGKWNYRRCPVGFFFSSYANKCQQEALNQQNECATSQQQQCQEGERIVQQDTASCQELLECVQGQWVQMKCPDGTIYDPTTSSCISGSCSTSPITGYGPAQFQPPVNPVGPPAPPPMSAAAAVDNTQVWQSCNGNLLIADQFDCSRYWECSQDGRFISQTCPPGSAFDASRSQCVLGSTCGGSSECSEGSYQPMETCGEYRICHSGRFIQARCDQNKVFVNGRCTQQDCQQNYDSGSYRECSSGAVRPHSSDISSYMICQYGQWTERKCSQGMVFDWKTLGCIQRPQDNWQPTKPQCYNGEKRPIRDQCERYEACEYGQWYSRSCSYGEFFSNGFCVEGNCRGGNGGGSCVESGGADGYRRVRHDCSKYYQCVHGNWMERPCAPGTFWNEHITTCDHKGNVPECGVSTGY